MPETAIPLSEQIAVVRDRVDVERILKEAQAICTIVVCNWRANHPGKGRLHPDLIAMMNQAVMNALSRRDTGLREREAEIERLRDVCSDAYQIVGVLAAKAEVFEHPDTARALDNLHAAAEGKPIPHSDLLPFPRTPFGK